MATSTIKKMNQLEMTSHSKSLSVPANDYGGTTFNLTKDGYYPIAIAGFNTTGSGAAGVPAVKVAFSSRSEGACSVVYGCRNVTSTARTALTANVDILWQKL